MCRECIECRKCGSCVCDVQTKEMENPFKEMFPTLSLHSYLELVGETGELENTHAISETESTSDSSPNEASNKTVINPENPSFCVCAILNFLVHTHAERDAEMGWKQDIHFITSCRQLACYYPELLFPLLPAIATRLCEFCKSLRSVVSRSALWAAADIFAGLKSRCLEAKEMFDLIKCIIQKLGTEKQFVRTDCISCLEAVRANDAYVNDVDCEKLREDGSRRIAAPAVLGDGEKSANPGALCAISFPVVESSHAH